MNKYLRNLLLLIFLISHQMAMGQIVSPSNFTANAVSSRSIQLTWVDNSSNETGFKIERSLTEVSGYIPIAIVQENATFLTDHTLTPNTTYFYRVSAVNVTEESAYSETVSVSTNDAQLELPYYWSNSDIGTPNLEGSATYENGYFETTGNGRLNATSNWFHFVYQPLVGDGEIIAQLTNMLKANWDHQGVMIKESLDEQSSYAMAELYRNDKVVMYKGRVGEAYKEVQDSSQNFDIPIWLKIARNGDQFISSHSKDGKQWQEFHRETISMGQNAFIGLVSHANTNDKLSPGTWRDVAASQSSIAAPTSLSATPSASDEIILSWSDNSDNETGFRIERAIKGDKIIFQDIAEVAANNTSFQDDGLTPGAIYFYRVRAINGNRSSFPTNEETAEVLTIPNTSLFLERKSGDEDRTGNNNAIMVTKTADTIKNILRHPGMNGKKIDVLLSQPASSTDGAISLKVMPYTHQQTIQFFTSESIKIRQVGSQLSVQVHDLEMMYDVTLDSITCNHIVLNFENEVMTPYVNGQFFESVSVEAFEVRSFSLEEYNGNLWDVLIVNSKMSDQSIYEQSERCTSGVEVSESPFSRFPYRICGVYNCLWVEEGDSETSTPLVHRSLCS
ncbi:MAG: fibronectin type III domain-containing protein [Bacteroidota bacterium]